MAERVPYATSLDGVEEFDGCSDETFEDLGLKLKRMQRIHRAQYDLFQYDQYDWSKFHNKTIAPLRLTQGYFSFVRKSALARIRKLGSWRANVQRDDRGNIVKVYAITDAKPDKHGKRKVIYLHRYLKEAHAHHRVDHENGWTLDNRDENLRPTSSRGNQCTAFCPNRRSKHPELLRGVEYRGVKKDRYGGRINITRRVGKNRVIKRFIYTSKKTWTDQRRAHEWYLKMHRKLFGQHCFEDEKHERTYPIFPPLKSVRAQKVYDALEIPF